MIFQKGKYNNVPQQVEENTRNIDELATKLPTYYRTDEIINQNDNIAVLSLTNIPNASALNLGIDFLVSENGIQFYIKGVSGDDLFISFYSYYEGPKGDKGDKGDTGPQGAPWVPTIIRLNNNTFLNAVPYRSDVFMISHFDFSVNDGINYSVNIINNRGLPNEQVITIELSTNSFSYNFFNKNITFYGLKSAGTLEVAPYAIIAEVDFTDNININAFYFNFPTSNPSGILTKLPY